MKNQKNNKIVVKALTSPIRLDLFLVNKLKKNRSYVDKLFENNLILLNQQMPKKKGVLLSNSDVIEILELKNDGDEIEQNKKISIPIIYEDDYVIVINKPKNVIVHKTSFKETNTLVDTLSNKIKINEFKDKLRPGIVHRLDRNTTGLMVIAKTKESYDSLVKQITNKTLVRKYYALVHNNFTDKFLLIKAPIDRSKQNVLKMVVSDEPSAKPAITEVTILENYKTSAFIECKLLTGRTHQIRVHLAYIHHPVFNDSLYGHYDGYKDYEQFLHAHYLSFFHPKTNELMKFACEPDNTFELAKNKLKNTINNN